MFHAEARYFEKNNRDAQHVKASPARRTDPDGRDHPGVMISYGQGRLSIMDPEQALRIANEIADALAEVR